MALSSRSPPPEAGCSGMKPVGPLLVLAPEVGGYSGGCIAGGVCMFKNMEFKLEPESPITGACPTAAVMPIELSQWVSEHAHWSESSTSDQEGWNFLLVYCINFELW